MNEQPLSYNHMTLMEDVAALREAAQSQEWDSCMGIFPSLFRAFPMTIVLQITLASLAKCLPFFEKNHPTVYWPRQGIEYAAKLEAIENPIASRYKGNANATGVFDEDGHAPKSSSVFLTAIYCFDHAYTLYLIHHDMENGIGLAVETVANAILSTLRHHHEENCPEVWEDLMKVTYRERPYLPNEKVQLTRSYVECVGEFWSGLWIEFADDIQQHIRN